MHCLFYEKETDRRGKITTIHHISDGTIYDMSEEEKKYGILTETLPPAPTPIKGKRYVLYCDPTTNEIWYEMFDRPLTKDEIMQETNEKLNLLLKIQLEQEGIL